MALMYHDPDDQSKPNTGDWLAGLALVWFFLALFVALPLLCGGPR